MIETGRWNSERDGPLSETALRRKFVAMGYAVHRYVYSPGTFFPEHTHAEDKIDAVLGGRFRIIMNGQCMDLVAGDWVLVPAGAKHSAEVIGREPVVSFDAVRLL